MLYMERGASPGLSVLCVTKKGSQRAREAKEQMGTTGQGKGCGVQLWYVGKQT